MWQGKQNHPLVITNHVFNSDKFCFFKKWWGKKKQNLLLNLKIICIIWSSMTYFRFMYIINYIGIHDLPCRIKLSVYPRWCPFYTTDWRSSQRSTKTLPSANYLPATYRWWLEKFPNRISDLKNLQKGVDLREFQTSRNAGSEKPSHLAKLSYSSLKTVYSFQNRSWWDLPKSGLGMIKPKYEKSSILLCPA